MRRLEIGEEMKRFFLYGFSLSIKAFVTPSMVFAQEPPPPAPAEVVDDLASAKELNRKGLVHFDAGDYARALPFFESSRALVPSHANTRNVALCLDGLGRKADALRVYESLVHEYGDTLDAREREATEKRIAELRQETLTTATPALKVAPPIAAPVLPVNKTPGRLTVGVFLGYAGGPSLGSDAETQAASTCGTNCPMANGVLVGGRVGYRIGSVFSLEVSGGYLQLGSSFQRDVANTYGAANDLAVTYSLDQKLALSGPFGGLGVSARFPITHRFSVVGRLGVAGLLADVSNTMSGDAAGTGDPTELAIRQERTMVRTTSALVTPEVTMEASFGGVIFGAGLGAWVSTLPGPSFGERRLLPSNPGLCTLNAESGGACAPESRVTSGERSNGVFAVFVPQISARYAF